MKFVGPKRWRDPTVGGPDDRRAVPVAHGPAHHEGRVPVGGVVAVEGVVPALRSAVGLEIRRSRGDGVDRVADVGVGDVGKLCRMGEGRGQELHRTLGAGKVRRAAVAVAPVVGLHPPDRRQDLPVELEAGRRLLVQREIRGRDPGDIAGRGDRPGGHRRKAAGEGARDTHDHDGHEDHDEGAAAAARAAARTAAAPCGHPVSGGAYLCGSASRSAGRVVSIAYSRRLTEASNATWLRPTNSSPSPGRACTSERRSAGVRSK